VYSSLPFFVLGFHGCDKSVCNKIINGFDKLHPSGNDYDWLGNGIYFWENDPHRALDYVAMIQRNPRKGPTIIQDPAVIGAIIDLGNCLNLVESKNLQVVRAAFELLKISQEKAGHALPLNKPIGKEGDLLLRQLDCAVIETLHAFNRETARPAYDTVRGVFWEGSDLYPNAGFKEKNHIQICVRNINCIKGYFSPLTVNPEFPLP